MGIVLLAWELSELLKSSDLVSCRTSAGILLLSALLTLSSVQDIRGLAPWFHSS